MIHFLLISLGALIATPSMISSVRNVEIYCGTIVTLLLFVIVGERYSKSISKSNHKKVIFIVSSIIFCFLTQLNLHFSLQLWLEIVALFTLSSLLAFYLSDSIKNPSEIILVLTTAAVADFMSTLWGPTEIAAEQLQEFYENPTVITEPLVNHFMLRIPVWSSRVVIPLFSVTDWFFVMFALASAKKCKIENALSIKYLPVSIPLLGLLIGILFAQLSGLFIPGIVFIAAATSLGLLIKSPESRYISDEMKKGALRITLLLIFIGTLLFILRSK